MDEYLEQLLAEMPDLTFHDVVKASWMSQFPKL